MTIVFDRQQSVPRQVHDLLRQKILNGELKPGASINERWLAEWLGVSRTPIREAIRRLSDAGLITTIPNVGTTVALINLGKVKELCLIRVSLESATIRIAAERYTGAAGATLRALIDRQLRAVRHGDHDDAIAADTAFHRTIIEIAGFTTVWSILQTVMAEVLRARHLAVRLPQRREEPVIEHRAIVDALEARDPDRCEAVASGGVPELDDRRLRPAPGLSRSRRRTGEPLPALIGPARH